MIAVDTNLLVYAHRQGAPEHRVALTARDNGADVVWTHDRGFVSVPGVGVHDPLA